MIQNLLIIRFQMSLTKYGPNLDPFDDLMKQGISPLGILKAPAAKKLQGHQYIL